METPKKWTNPSVVDFAKGRDPVQAITDAAREIVMRAIDQGWVGPPFDPLALADILKLEVVPRDDVSEARTVPTGRGSVLIEFNPNRPQARVRFSVAHEISHTLFPDCSKVMRYRLGHREATPDEWQLEALCNIAAAEFLMPLGSLPPPSRGELSMDHLLRLRLKYQVSTEAIFIRVAHVSGDSCAVFSASRPESPNEESRYRLDYLIGSRNWTKIASIGSWLPRSSLVAECRAIGYTAKGVERWGQNDPWHIESVGVSPYPGSRYPRVLGIVIPRKSSAQKVEIFEVTGDALAPRGEGARLIVHVVNDATANWGGAGFAQAVRSRWPAVQDDFKNWIASDRSSLSLGSVRITRIDDRLSIASMICQKGYGLSSKPRIRYAALKQCLSTVAEVASRERMSVHMPRIGTGQAGGSWDIVRELVETSLCSAAVPVTVYDPPDKTGRTTQIQQSLKLNAAEA